MHTWRPSPWIVTQSIRLGVNVHEWGVSGKQGTGVSGHGQLTGKVLTEGEVAVRKEDNIKPDLMKRQETKINTEKKI